MSEVQSAVSKKQKKQIEQWAETNDAFVNQLYKKLRNGQKKLNNIAEVEQKIKAKEIQPTQELLDKVQRKDKIKAEMDEVLGYLNIYKESFPENPAFAAGASKKKAPKAEPVQPVVQVAPVVEQAPAVDVNKVVEDALSFVAESVIFGNLSKNMSLSGTNSNINDALAHLLNGWYGLTKGAGTWQAAKGTFVDTFSRLVNKSSTQVAHSNRSYADIHAYLATLSAGDGQTLLEKEREHHHHHHKNHHHHKKAEEAKNTTAAAQEETKAESTPVDEATPVEGEAKASPVAEGGAAENGESPVDHQKDGGHRGNRRGGRGGNRGGYFKKHNQDEEGFTFVKEDGESHANHYPSRRHQNATRGSFRGGRGGQKDGERGGNRGERGERGGRGGNRGGDRPWTAKEHRNAGEVRKTEFEPPGESNGPKGETQ